MSEPRRLRDAQRALPAELARALSGAPGKPSELELQQLARRLGGALGVVLPVPSTLSLRAVEPVAKVAEKAAVSSGSLAAKPLGAVAAWALAGAALGVGLSGVAAYVASVPDNPTPKSVPAARHTASATPRRSSVATSPDDRQATSAADVGRPHTQPTPALPAPPPARVTVSDDRPAIDAQESELSLLRRAQRALTDDPAQALALSSLHAQRFGEGVLGQEREVIAVDALLRLGRSEEARARAATFLSRYSGSAHARRLELLLSHHSAH